MKLPINKLVNNTGQIDSVPANPRTINKDDYQKLINSLQEDPDFMNHKPLHVYKQGEKYVVLGGNMRLKALKELGYKEVPVTVYKPETSPEVLRARIMKDNAEYGSWDMDMLANEWSSEPLDDWGVDLPDDWLQDEEEVVEDEAPEVDESEPPKSKLGEIYQLGRHRIMCADSTVKDNVEKLMDGNKADLVFTDPPWNVNYGAVKAGNAQGYKANRTIENDNMGEDFTPWMNAVFGTMAEFSKDGCMTYVVMSAQEWGGLMSTLKDNGYHWSSTIIWNKDHLVLSRKDYHTKYEPIWYGWKEGESRLHPLKDRKQSDVWDIDRPTRSDEHPTMKPIELCARAINNSSDKDSTVLDLFLGSGSTLIACEQTDRTCYGMELSEAYTDVVRKRWAKYVYPDRWEEEWESLTPAIEM